jgi:hypothetical protein
MYSAGAYSSVEAAVKCGRCRQGRALGKVAQEGVKEGRANVAVVGGAERVQAAREGGGSDRSGVI